MIRYQRLVGDLIAFLVFFAVLPCFANTDGDGRDELAIARYGDFSPHFRVHDDESEGYEEILTNSDEWGDHRPATAVAWGDVDGDGRDELAVGRDSDSGHKIFIYDDKTAGFAVLGRLALGWGDGRYPTALAFGDLDFDGRDELVVGRHARDHERMYIYDDLCPQTQRFQQCSSEPSVEAFAEIHAGQANWDEGIGVVSVAVGDLDGDGFDEIALARDADTGARVIVYDDARTNFAGMWSTGETWDDDKVATVVAFGNFDEDGRQELAYGRYANDAVRWRVLDDACPKLSAGQYCDGRSPHADAFAVLREGGATWGDDRYTTALAFGDLDGDQNDELILGRRANDGPRFFLVGNSTLAYQELASGGADWPEGWSEVTALAAGSWDEDRPDEFVVALSSLKDVRDNGNRPTRYQHELTYFPTFDDLCGSTADSCVPVPNGSLPVRLVYGAFGATAGDNYISGMSLRSPKSPKDSDRDGLPDTLEISRLLDDDGDHNPDTQLPEGVSPFHKDILIEMDVMRTRTPYSAGTLQALKDAFARAPIDAGGFPNPDGQPGINLWFDTPNGDFENGQGEKDLDPVTFRTTQAECEDGYDNDGDGLEDAEAIAGSDFDPECVSSLDGDESTQGYQQSRFLEFKS